ncbi:RIP metalloprotease RseP [uncultured Parvimonas sp.]|uniref:RIP metalloprotease RseP n=1 Tax=uncultured Parvimonas sp. TaxID=747372 RepID=UPI0028D5D978|nr:RIP metalloprotease RseP [uncultured Parvimonas sp.]
MIIKIIIALLVFMVVVVVHEFGHFIFAKRAKIKVNEFSVGMGPKIFGKQKGETLYSVRALPLGGFCAMEGEDEEEEEQDIDFSQRGHFNGATIGGRILTIFAGPFFNFILAFVILFALFGIRGHQTTTVASIQDNSIAQKYGIEVGDKIVNIGDNKINSWKDIQTSLSKLDKEETTIKVIRNGQEKEIKVKFENSNEKVLGVTSKLERNLFVSIRETFNTFFYFIGTMFDILRQLFTGKVGVGQLSGPIGVVGAISSAASNGIYSLLYITAFLSVNLGFINLLPIPALDGGRLVFLFIELILRRPVSRSKEGLIHTIGFIFLMGLILFVSFKDVIRLGIFGAN